MFMRLMRYAICVFVTVAALSGCKNTIDVKYHPRLHRVALNAYKGDVVRWDENVQGFKFLIPNSEGGIPCEGGTTQVEDKKTVCKIVVDTGVFPYGCTGCTDPEVV